MEETSIYQWHKWCYLGHGERQRLQNAVTERYYECNQNTFDFDSISMAQMNSLFNYEHNTLERR